MNKPNSITNGKLSASGKSAESPIVVGLDIGTTKIAVIVAQRDQYGKLKILGKGQAESYGVTRGEVTNIKDTTEAIIEAVQEAERISGVDIKVVYVGIAGQHISSKQNRGIYMLSNPQEEITSADIRNMVDDMHRLALDPGERIIHVLPQEFSIDNHHGIKNPIGWCGSRLEANFHIITGKVAAAQNIKRCVERAGLQMLGLVLEPLASSAAVLHEDEMEAGVVLVDIGGGTTDVAIFKDGIIRHTAVIPFAGNIITEDIMEGCKLLRPQAEKLKVKFGSALPGETHENEIISIPGIAGRDRKEISMRTLAHIINARVEEIFAQVYFEIKGSGFANTLNAGIVVTGGGSQLKHIKQMVEYTTGLSTRIGYPTQYLAKDTRDDLKNPMYATGIGLMLEGYKEMEKETSEYLVKAYANKLKSELEAALEEPVLLSPKADNEVIEEVQAPEVPAENIKAEAEVSVTNSNDRSSLNESKQINKNPFKDMFRSIKDWFEDDRVNRDYE